MIPFLTYWGTWTSRHFSESPSPLTAFNSRITALTEYLSISMSQFQIRETLAISHNSLLSRSRIARFRKLLGFPRGTSPPSHSA